MTIHIAIKKAVSWRIDAFELGCWRRLLRALWCKDIKPVNPKGNQSWILTGRTDAKAEAPKLWTPVAKNWLNIDSWEGVMLKLKLQYFGHLMQRTDSFEKPWCWERLKAGEEDDRGWDSWMASPTQWTWVWASSGSWWWTGKPGVLQSMASQRVRPNWVTKLN